MNIELESSQRNRLLKHKIEAYSITERVFLPYVYATGGEHATGKVSQSSPNYLHTGSLLRHTFRKNEYANENSLLELLGFAYFNVSENYLESN